MRGRPQGGGPVAEHLYPAVVQMTAQRAFARGPGSGRGPHGVEQGRGRRGPVGGQLLTEPDEPFTKGTECGDGGLHAGQVVAQHPSGVDAGIETERDGLQRQAQTAERQYLIQADEVLLGVLPVPARGAP